MPYHSIPGTEDDETFFLKREARREKQKQFMKKYLKCYQRPPQKNRYKKWWNPTTSEDD